jgi:hypothetical protein
MTEQDRAVAALLAQAETLAAKQPRMAAVIEAFAVQVADLSPAAYRNLVRQVEAKARALEWAPTSEAETAQKAGPC